MFALQSAQIYDQDLWTNLKKLALEKDFDYEVVNNSRWSVNHFLT